MIRYKKYISLELRFMMCDRKSGQRIVLKITGILVFLRAEHSPAPAISSARHSHNSWKCIQPLILFSKVVKLEQVAENAIEAGGNQIIPRK